MATTNNDGCLPQSNAAAASGKSGSAGLSGRSTSSSAGKNTAADGSVDVSSASSTSGASESATAKNEKKGKNLYEYLDSFASSVENSSPVTALDKATAAINDVDCGDVVFKFMEDNVPKFKEAVALLNKGIGFMNGFSTGVSLSTGMAGSDFVQKICDMLSKMMGTIDGYIEVVVKGAFVVFKRIDAMMERLENTLINLTDAIRNCILDVFRDLAAFIKRALNIGLKIDWTSLTELMQDCPCVARVIAALTGCQEDDAGNDIRRNPVAIVTCIQNKFPFLDPSSLTTAVDKIYSNYIKKYVNMAFGFIQSWIAYVYNLLIKPLRCLIKKYAEMLTYKIDVTGMVNLFDSFSCFLVYTEEYKKGKKYYGMSIIDMINTFRQWIPCFQHACPNFSSKVNTRSKELYKDLRLDDKYWRSAYAIDIYMMCINTGLSGQSPRDSELRAMFPESPIDLVMSWFRSAKNQKKENDEETDTMGNGAATVDEVNEYAAEHDGDYPPNAPDPLSTVIELDGKLDNENSVNEGDEPMDTMSADAITSMMDNMYAAGEPYYVEKFYQLIRLLGRYSMPEKFLDTARRLLSFMETSDTTYRDAGDYLRPKTGRPDVSLDETEHVATYSVDDDYDEDKVAALSDPAVFAGYDPVAGSLASFYAQRYAGVGA